MAREWISQFKKEAARGSATAALRLLERSIRFRHKKLSVLRFLIAERLGAALTSDHIAYCRDVAQSLTDDQLLSILAQVRKHVGDPPIKGANLDTRTGPE
jgi:hypothetical protein